MSVRAVLIGPNGESTEMIPRTASGVTMPASLEEALEDIEQAKEMINTFLTEKIAQEEGVAVDQVQDDPDTLEADAEDSE